MSTLKWSHALKRLLAADRLAGRRWAESVLIPLVKRVDEKSVEAMERFEIELGKPARSVPVKGGSKVTKTDAVVPVGKA